MSGSVIWVIFAVVLGLALIWALGNNVQWISKR